MSNRQPPVFERTTSLAMPEVDMRHVLNMTDDTGIFQHAIYSSPDPNHGYCIDDNARALIAGLRYAQLYGYDESQVPLMRYLTFLGYAFNDQNGVFRNFMSYQRTWLEDMGSDDSQGRAIWALGLTTTLAPHDSARDFAIHLIEKALPKLSDLAYLRSWAFVVIGLCEYLVGQDDDDAARLRDTYAMRLFDAFDAVADDPWLWPEPWVTYDNAKLPHALLCAGQAMGQPKFIDLGCRVLRWLLERQTAETGHLSVIGNQGWLTDTTPKADFDQQPLEAYALVETTLEAARITKDARWADHARRCFDWFTGANDLNSSLYDPQTGGCCDGLTSTGPNRNQGAESTLAYVLSTLELHRYLNNKKE